MVSMYVSHTLTPGDKNRARCPNGRRCPTGRRTYLSETSVGLTRQTGDTPAADDTLEALALGDTDDIDHLGGGEHLLDGETLLEVLEAQVNLKWTPTNQNIKKADTFLTIIKHSSSFG